MALNPDQGETVGWPRFIATSTRPGSRSRRLSEPTRSIFTENYGEAGAIDLLGRRTACRALSAATTASASGANRGRPTPRVPPRLRRPVRRRAHFTGCTPLARINNPVGLDNDEQGLPVMLCRPVGILGDSVAATAPLRLGRD